MGMLVLFIIISPRAKSSQGVQLGSKAELAAPLPAGSTLRVCVFKWQPFAYEKAGVLSGVMVDLVRDMIEQLGYSVEFHLGPPLRCLQGLRNQTMTLNLFTSSFSLSEAGDHFLAIKPSVHYYLPSIFVPSNHPTETIAGLDYLVGWRIASLRGNPLVRRYQRLLDITWVHVNRTDALWSALESNNADAILGGYQSFVLLDKSKQQNHRILLPPINSEPIYWVVHQDNRILAQQLEAQLVHAQEEGTLDTHYRNHLGMSFKKIKAMVESSQFEPLEAPAP